MEITSLADFIGWIKVKLGGGYQENGVVAVELSDEQVRTCIYDSVQYAQRYLGDASYEAYVALSLSAGVSTYNLSGSDIISVIDLNYGQGGPQGINVLFSPTNLIFQGRFDIFNGSNTGIVDWEIYNQFLYDVNRMFAIEFRVMYNEAMQQLNISPTPNQNLSSIIKTYKKVPMLNLYNNTLIKFLALARAKKQLSIGYRKYSNLLLPGNGSLYQYGESLNAEGADEERYYMNEIKSNSEPLGFFTG